MQRALRAVTAISIAGAMLVAGMPEAGAAKGGGSAASCSRRKPCTNPDTTAPTVSISTPSAGATLAGSVTVAGTAADDVGVVGVEIQTDAGPYQPAAGTTSWSAVVDSEGLADGSHTITARVVDGAGNASVRSVSIMVSNSSTDTAPPVVTIVAPSGGAVVSDSAAVTGTAEDDSSVAIVEVQIDGGPFVPASGTVSWSANVDTAAYADGPHQLTVRATDGAGNAAVTTTEVTFANTSTVGADMVISDPRATYDVLPLGRTRLAQWGPVTGVLYTEQFTNRRAVAFRDSASGQTSYVDLPSESLAGWTNAATVMTSASDLWVFGGAGPLMARHYRLAGSPMPTTAELAESRTFGDSDSREGDALALQSGGLVFTWGQQGNAGPEGLFVAHRSAAGAWQQLPAMTHAPSFASDEVLGQHPSDGSIWLFNSPDAWGAIGAAHLTETAAGLRVDWTDGQYINENKYGLNGPDPENPNLALAPDPSTGTLALAYQSADRRYFTNASTTRVGSRVAVARIAATGAPSFLVLPVWAERVSAVGLTLSAGETVVSHRPIDEATLAFDKVYVSRHRNGAWEPATLFGSITSTDRVTFGSGRPEFATRLSDGKVHLRTF